MTHLLCGEDRVLLPAPVTGNDGHLHDQELRLLAPDAAFKLAALSDENNNFQAHAERPDEAALLKAKICGPPACIDISACPYFCH